MRLIEILPFLSYPWLVLGTLIDPETPYLTKTRQADGKKLTLVMSDEFNQEGRGFASAEDEIFEALDRPDNSNESIQYYNASKEYATTRGGSLVITTKPTKASWYQWDSSSYRPIRLTKNYTSAMVQSWNKFCFTGGVLELAVRLPGYVDGGGLWPAIWLNGNLARVTYEASTVFTWPWSYDRCGEIDHLEEKQEINACDPHPGFGLNPNQGRGAPEIDLFEVMSGAPMPGYPGPTRAFMSSSLQLAPGLPKDIRPRNGHPLNSSQVWYKDLFVGERSALNFAFWGQECGPTTTMSQSLKYMEDSLSANTYLEDTHYNEIHNYKLEWQPGEKGYLMWYLDDKLIFGINGTSISDLTGGLIPVEPMYIIMNIALSHRWGMPEPCPVSRCAACYQCYDCTNPDCQCALPEGLKGCRVLPAEMHIDYVRLYQDLEDSSHSLGCSTPSFPSADFINAHPERYQDWKAFQVAQGWPAVLVLLGLSSFQFSRLVVLT
eukprot:gene4434-4858_t